MMRNTDFAILSVSLLGLGGESYAVKLPYDFSKPVP